MIYLLMPIALLFLQSARGGEQRPPLSRDAVWMIVMSTPAGVELEARQGCPEIEFIPEGKDLMYVQFRNGCPVSGSALIDNYTVDLRTGKIWTGTDEKKYVDSERLRRLRLLLGIKQGNTP